MLCMSHELTLFSLFSSIHGRINHLRWKQHSLHVPTKSRKLELGMHSRSCWTCMEILVLARLQLPLANRCRCQTQNLLRFRRHLHRDRILLSSSWLNIYSFCSSVESAFSDHHPEKSVLTFAARAKIEGSLRWTRCGSDSSRSVDC